MDNFGGSNSDVFKYNKNSQNNIVNTVLKFCYGIACPEYGSKAKLPNYNYMDYRHEF